MQEASKPRTIERGQFAIEIEKGLSADRKYISSKFFYDQKGDDLFTQIMDLDEYYLTRSEFEIFNEQKALIYQALKFKNEEFDIAELGSGDGTKTRILIEEFMNYNRTFHYLPIDISMNSLNLLKKSLNQIFPIEIHTFNHQYLDGLRSVYRSSPDRPKLILFLGSNIGNLKPPKAEEFLREIYEIKGPEDYLLLGIDLKKDPIEILSAYNDSKGITREFNLNVLERINRELGANFNLDKFYHYPVYDPHSGAARSYLVSKEEQEVYIEQFDKSFCFATHETIYTEISQKYSLTELNELATNSGFKLVESFIDSGNRFADVLLK